MSLGSLRKTGPPKRSVKEIHNSFFYANIIVIVVESIAFLCNTDIEQEQLVFFSSPPELSKIHKPNSSSPR